METTGKLAKKLAAAMAEIGRVQKRGSNQAQGYKYARADDVAEEARTVLASHGIAVNADVLESGVREITTAYDNGKSKTLRISTCRVAWTFEDTESGEKKTVHTPGEGMDSGDKGVYKAMTGAMKYFLMLNFLIPTGDGDPEVESEHDRDERKPARKQTPQPVTEGNGDPGNSDARKLNVSGRLASLGYKSSADKLAWVGEKLGRPADKSLILEVGDWLALDVELRALEDARAALARAENNAAKNGATA